MNYLVSAFGLMILITWLSLDYFGTPVHDIGLERHKNAWEVYRLFNGGEK